MDVCRQCQQVFRRRRNGRAGFNKEALTRKLRGRRELGTTVLEALTQVYLYEGPCTGHVCGPCFLQLERDYRIYQQCDNMIEKKRKDGTPHKSPGKKPRHEASDSSPSSTPPSSPLPSSSGAAKSLFTSPRPNRSTRIPKYTCQLKRSRICTPKKTSNKTKNKFEPVMAALTHGNFYSALRHILKGSPKARKALYRIVQQTVVAELRQFGKKASCDSTRTSDVESLSKFSYGDLLNDAAQNMPLLHGALLGSIGEKPSTVKSSLTETKKLLLQPRIGLILSVVLYTHNPVKFQMLQAITSLQLWRYGAKEKLFKYLNHLGVCKSNSATKDLVDRIQNNKDVPVLEVETGGEGQ